MAAEIECTVDLAGGQKGVHMSRFPELFDEAIDEVVDRRGPAWSRSSPSTSPDTSSSARARSGPRCGSPHGGRSVAGDAGDRPRDAGDGRAHRHRRCGRERVRRLVGVEAPGSTRARARRASCATTQPNACSRPGSRRDVERILELVPLATHNQRGRGTLYVGTEQGLDAERARRHRREVDERAGRRAAEAARRAVRRRARAPAAALRRGLGRLALRDVLDANPGFADDDFVLSRQLNMETIHAHDVVAERYGTIGELRGRAGGGRAAARHTSLADWLRS